jgi:hypothetical protein
MNSPVMVTKFTHCPLVTCGEDNYLSCEGLQKRDLALLSVEVPVEQTFAFSAFMTVVARRADWMLFLLCGLAVAFARIGF